MSGGVHLAAGACSGLVSAVALQPFDLVKTRIQQSSGERSIVKTVQTICKGNKAARELWRGALPSAIRTSLGSALYFTSLNVMREYLSNAGVGQSRTSALPRLNRRWNLVTGALARTMVGFITMPVTIIKLQYESSFFTHKSMWDACSQIWRKERFRGFFSGFGATAVRDAPYAGLYVLFYEQSKQGLAMLLPPTSTPASSTTSAMVHITSGILAASTATAITNPADLIKTRIQVAPSQYRNMVYAVKKVYHEQGLKGFFDGLSLRMSRKALSSAITWSIYEEILRRVKSVAPIPLSQKAL